MRSTKRCAEVMVQNIPSDTSLQLYEYLEKVIESYTEQKKKIEFIIK